MIEVQKLALNSNCVLTPIYPVIKNIEITSGHLQNLKEEHFKKIKLSDTGYINKFYK